MEQKGEFEQRPEVHPADSVALPKQKASPVAVILCVLFALVACGLGGYIAYDKLIASDDGGDDNSTKCMDRVVEEEEKEEEKSEEKLGDNPPFDTTTMMGDFLIEDGALYYSVSLGDLAGAPIKNVIDESFIGNAETHESKLVNAGGNITIYGTKVAKLKGVTGVYNLKEGQGFNNTRIVILVTQDSGKLGAIVATIGPRPSDNAVCATKIDVYSEIKGYEDVVGVFNGSIGDGAMTFIQFKDGSYKSITEDEVMKNIK